MGSCAESQRKRKRMVSTYVGREKGYGYTIAARSRILEGSDGREENAIQRVAVEGWKEGELEATSDQMVAKYRDSLASLDNKLSRGPFIPFITKDK